MRANVLATLDANLLQRATAAAQSGIDPRVLTQVPTEVLGAADIRLALLLRRRHVRARPRAPRRRRRWVADELACRPR